MVRDGATCPRSFTAPIFIRYLSFERPKHPKRAMVATDLDGDQNVDVRERTPPEERESVHARLRGDIEAIRAYGDAHPDDWTEYSLKTSPLCAWSRSLAGPHLEEHDRARGHSSSIPSFSMYDRHGSREIIWRRCWLKLANSRLNRELF